MALGVEYGLELISRDSMLSKVARVRTIQRGGWARRRMEYRSLIAAKTAGAAWGLLAREVKMVWTTSLVQLALGLIAAGRSESGQWRI